MKKNIKLSSDNREATIEVLVKKHPIANQRLYLKFATVMMNGGLGIRIETVK